MRREKHSNPEDAGTVTKEKQAKYLCVTAHEFRVIYNENLWAVVAREDFERKACVSRILSIRLGEFLEESSVKKT